MLDFLKTKIEWLEEFLLHLKEMDNKSQCFMCVDYKDSKMKGKLLIARNRGIVEVFDLWENINNTSKIEKIMNDIYAIVPKDELKAISCEASSHSYWDLIVWGKIPTKIWRGF